MLRVMGCWLIGSVLAGPMSCGSSNETASSKATVQKTAVVEVVEAEQPKVDPNAEVLVPAIDIGGQTSLSYNGVSIVGTGAGAIDFVPDDFFDFQSDDRASFHAHGGKVCASGCAASRHPTKKLTPYRFKKLLEQFANEPMDETSDALEHLVYFGRQTQRMVNLRGLGSLDEQRAKFLRQQLTYTHALISFRIVDEYGKVRVFMPPTRVPLDRRHVFQMEVNELPHLITSGTVKRVGVHHLWTRL